MSIEESLAQCVLGTGLAGVACLGAAGTGGLGAAACGLSVASAAVDCYGAGKDAWEWYEKNHPEEAREILEREREEREREEREVPDSAEFIDENASDDDSWNSIYQAGIDHLAGYSSGAALYAKIGESFFPVSQKFAHLGSNQRNRLAANTKEQARDALLGVNQSWLDWLGKVKAARFTTLDQANMLTGMIRNVRKFTAMRHYLKRMTFPS